MVHRWLVLVMAFVLLPSSGASAAQAPPPSADAGSSRLFFGPTGRLVPPGQANLATFGVLAVPVVTFGITSRASLAIGAPVSILFCAWCNPVVFVSPKVQLHRTPTVQVAAGTIHLAIPGEDGMGIAFVAGTHGPADASVTVGGLLPYGQGGVASPIFLIGGERRLNERIVFVTENYLGSSFGMLTAGIRVERRIFTLDAGVVLPYVVGEIVVAGPLVNLSWRLGGAR